MVFLKSLRSRCWFSFRAFRVFRGQKDFELAVKKAGAGMRMPDQQFDPDSPLKDVTIVNISHVVVLHELDYYFLQESWLANYSKSPVALPPERTMGMAVSPRK